MVDHYDPGHETPLPILFLPGHMCDDRAWQPVGDRLEAAGLDVGHARLDLDATIEGMADRALAAAPERFVAIGFSMGAVTALTMSARSPDRVAGLCLTAINPGPDLPDRSAARRLHQDRVRHGELAAVTRDDFVPSYLAADNARRDDLAALCIDMALTVGAETFVRQSEALRTRGDQRPVLAGVRRPMLVIGGVEDRLCPPAWHEAVAMAVPGAQLELIDHAGHLVPLEQSDVVADAILRWLESEGLFGPIK